MRQSVWVEAEEEWLMACRTGAKGRWGRRATKMSKNNPVKVGRLVTVAPIIDLQSGTAKPPHGNLTAGLFVDLA